MVDHPLDSTANPRPILATPEQIAAEAAVLRFLADTEVISALTHERQRLLSTQIAQSRDGEARLSQAIHAWAGGLAFRWLSGDPENPAILLTTDNTPRNWLGHEMPATGAAGDNPDHIYRNCFVDGAGQYEIVGKIDPDCPPAQFNIEVMRGLPGSVVVSAASNGTGVQTQVGVLTNKEIRRSTDGAFRVTLSPDDDSGPNHIKTTTERLCFVIRDVLSSWHQVPTRLSLRRIDRPHGIAMSYEQLKARILADLPEYLDFWAAFPLRWMGGVEPNGFKSPVPREGGWGYQAGIRFQLDCDEFLLVTVVKGKADYFGIQISDPWFIAPDARHHVSSLNTSQAAVSADGNYTYVIGAEDPGVANWLDTGGVHEGVGVLRWQGVPPGEEVERHLLEVRKVTRDHLDRDYPDLPRLTADQRESQRRQHASDYSQRFL